MTVEMLTLIVVAVIVVTLANAYASRIGVAGPLVIVAIGVAVSLIPAVPALTVPPEIILVGILPPLLYSAAVAAPAREFKRDFGAISGLAVVLVVVSSLVLGAFFSWAIPSLGFPLAVALGAILSPTDAVATSIVRAVGAPRRVVTVLEGESLLNDATALVTLRTAIAATAAGFSVVATVGSFLWSVSAAIVVGALVGFVALRLRAWTRSATANTALGLTIPYLAYVPTETLGGSGLVAAVVAGLVCGQGAARWLTPEQRISDKLNWSTIEFVLEGVVFLAMGLQLWGLVERNLAAGEGLGRPLALAAIAFLLVVAVRAAYVFPLIGVRNVVLRRTLDRRISRPSRSSTMRRADPGLARADRAYFESAPLTWRHSTILVWAGMRGVVTLAAAQTLPANTPERDLLVLIAFLVAAGSLALQGGTLPALARGLGLAGEGREGPDPAEIRAIDDELRRMTARAVADRQIILPGVGDDPAEALAHSHVYRTVRADREGAGGEEGLMRELAVIRGMRSQLRVLARTGRYGTPALRYVRDELDAYEISVKLHLDGSD